MRQASLLTCLVYRPVEGAADEAGFSGSHTSQLDQDPSTASGASPRPG